MIKGVSLGNWLLLEKWISPARGSDRIAIMTNWSGSPARARPPWGVPFSVSLR